jgi:hypothetical protein
MSEKDLDNLFREFGNDRPYYGSWEWFEEIQKNNRQQEVYEDMQLRLRYQRAEQIKVKWIRRDHPFGT